MIHVLLDEDALNKGEEVDALIEYFSKPVRGSNPKTFCGEVFKMNGLR